VAGAPNQSDPQGGGHATLITGYRTNAAGLREWKLRNSWGASWCEAGYCWCSAEWLTAVWELHPLAMVLEVPS
jgi:C1A family cysteine protease